MPTSRRNGRRRWFYFSYAVMLIIYLLGWRGWPIDDWSLLVMVTPGLFLAATLLSRYLCVVSYPMVLAFAFFMHFPLQCYAIQDVLTGRRGYQIQPFDVQFSVGGPHASWIEDRLGYRGERWYHHTPVATPFSYGFRDGDERVNSRNLIFKPYLRDVLRVLPDEDAETRALSCIANPANVMRMHQCWLLVAVAEFGFPQGMTAKEWWQHHKPFFEPVYDVDQAAKMVFGWRHRMKPPHDSERFGSINHALSYQERGSWGGDEDFGPAIDRLQKMYPDEKPDDPGFGVHQVVWWD